MNDLAASATTPGPGHNLPTTYDLLLQEVQNVIAEANRALNTVKVVSDEETAKKLDGFDSKLKNLWNDAEARRKAEKKPHDDAAAAVQTRYATPILTPISVIRRLIKPLLDGWLVRQDEIRKAAAKEAEEIALAAMREAEEAAKKAQAKSGDIVGAVIAAEEAAKKAEAAVKVADQTANTRTQIKGDYSERARSLRSTWKGKITDQDQVYRFFRGEPDVLDALQKLVDSRIRASEKGPNGKPTFTIPGVNLFEERTSS